MRMTIILIIHYLINTFHFLFVNIFFTISIYFVHIPWNIERLNISESELGFGLFIFGICIFFSNQIRKVCYAQIIIK